MRGGGRRESTVSNEETCFANGIPRLWCASIMLIDNRRQLADMFIELGREGYSALIKRIT